VTTALRLWDTRRRAKVPLDFSDRSKADPISMYVCGPTVYSRAHIGNARPAVVFDVLARLLRHLYGHDSLVYARNITDIDDKIMKAAAERGVSTDTIAAEFERHYNHDMAALGVAPPDLQPRAINVSISAIIAGTWCVACGCRSGGATPSAAMS
jgi:cysteinyl-tRNA synthetase